MEETYFYYQRDEENKPRITICLLKANGDLARGVAICSRLDNPCKKTGRKIAKDRAAYAMRIKHNGCPVWRKHAMREMDKARPYQKHPVLKAEFNPKPTDFELGILESKEKRHDPERF